MRLFVAIEFDEFKEDFESIQKKILPLGKFNLPKHFHLTLKFMGACDESKLDEIRARLKEVTFEPFEVNLLGLGAFPSPDSVKVVWAGVDSHERIVDIQQQIEKKMGSFFPPERMFHPHITLARVKQIKNHKLFFEIIKKIRFDHKKQIKGFKLYKSVLTPDGPVYSPIDL